MTRLYITNGNICMRKKLKWSVLNRINKETLVRFTNMINLLQHQFALALLLLLRHRVSGSDCQRWHNAIEFWSNVTCSMEDTKTVNFHSVLESGESFLGRCFQAFVYDIARKCETAIVSRIYTLRDTDNLTFSDVVRPVERPPIWKVASSGEDAIPFRVMGPAGKTRIRSKVGS